MCASCGCGIPDDDRGDERNITMADLEDAADAAGISIEEIVDNIQASVLTHEEREKRTA